MTALRLALLAGACALAPALARAQGAAPAPAPAIADTVCAKPSFSRFDFWAGEWVVRDTLGNVIGHSSVTRDVGGCALHEHWRSAKGGGVGESFTAWSPFDGKWHQLYVGNGGYILSMTGGFEGDRLVMELAPRPSQRDPAVQIRERWSWTPIDASHVRQTAAISTDGGTTWKTQFDGVYERAR